MINRLADNPIPSDLSKTTSDGIAIHALADDMPHLPQARFTRRGGDAAIYALACGFPANEGRAAVYRSQDGGRTWEETASLSPSAEFKPSDSGAFIGTRRGTLIAAFSNQAERAHWNWDSQTHDSPGATLPTYTVRSVDGGETWTDLQRLHTEWTGANRDMIETRDGRVVFTSMKIRHHPGRHTVLTYASDDEGRHWEPSNVIDLGGNGHHGGVTEATLVELRDGRLLKYIRTNWGQFWRALSTDGGRSWHPYGPAGVDASSAPGALLRLADGRIALAWNRWYPEGQTTVALQGGDGDWSATPCSNFREELSLSLSDDECETWSAPVVVARNPGSEVSYPYLFEPEPGTLWVTAQRWKLRMRIREHDLLAIGKPGSG